MTAKGHGAYVGEPGFGPEPRTIHSPPRKGGITMKKLFAALSITAAAVFALAVLAGASRPPEPDAAALISALLDYDAPNPCPFNCEVEDCEDGHELIKDSDHGNDIEVPGVGAHSCFAGITCEIHDCLPDSNSTLSLGDLEVVRDLIPALPVERLLAMDQAEPNLLFSPERQTVHVLGCGGLVLTNIELTPSQKAALVALDLDGVTDVG